MPLCALHSFHFWHKITCMNFLLDSSAYNLHQMIMLYYSSQVGYVALTLNGNPYKKVEFIWVENQQAKGLLLLERQVPSSCSNAKQKSQHEYLNLQKLRFLSPLPPREDECATTKDIFEEKNSNNVFFIYIIQSKICLFTFKNIRAHKYTWLKTIDFG